MGIFDIIWTKTFIIADQRISLAYLVLHDILEDVNVFTLNSASVYAELLKFQGDIYKTNENLQNETQITRRIWRQIFNGTGLPSLRISEGCMSYVGQNRLSEVPVSPVENTEI